MISSEKREGKEMLMEVMAVQEDNKDEMCDILIFCSGSMIGDLSRLFQKLMEDYKQVDLLWSGFSQRHEMGILVLECEGALPEIFQDELKTNRWITDYTSYPVPSYFPAREH
jgi:hypothetical protein